MVDAAGGVPVLADMKTHVNTRYEFELAYGAGAAAATAMATAPGVTLDTCFTVARERGVTVMVNLLGSNEARRQAVLGRYSDGVFAVHVSKDAQESGGTPSGAGIAFWNQMAASAGRRRHGESVRA